MFNSVIAIVSNKELFRIELLMVRVYYFGPARASHLDLRQLRS